MAFITTLYRLPDVMQSVIMQSVIMQSVIMQSVIMQSVIMLNVLGPIKGPKRLIRWKLAWLVNSS